MKIRKSGKNKLRIYENKKTTVGTKKEKQGHKGNKKMQN